VRRALSNYAPQRIDSYMAIGSIAEVTVGNLTYTNILVVGYKLIINGLLVNVILNKYTIQLMVVMCA